MFSNTANMEVIEVQIWTTSTANHLMKELIARFPTPSSGKYIIWNESLLTYTAFYRASIEECLLYSKGGGTPKRGKSNYLIDTKTWLAIAIWFFVGADPYNLLGVYDVGYHASVIRSVWVVIDVLSAILSNIATGSFRNAGGQTRPTLLRARRSIEWIRWIWMSSQKWRWLL